MNNIKSYLFLSLFLSLFSTSLYSQLLDKKLGELLIKTDYPIEDILSEFAQFDGERTDLKLIKKISPSINIYHLSFDYVHIHERYFKEAISRSHLVETVQFNHIISYRNTPDDTEFDAQWQYINTGQSGGTAGADIDMDLAWDITTGGLTVLGDTIVAAIIDDGLAWTHDDFGDNIWFNYNEIPNNGIDDDNNGYVDDYQGWNAYTNNDVITGGGHGTPVAGIVGAKGDNDNGVAGVNWNVKLMIIQGGGDEAEALAAYAYCYEHRKRYNDSNGQEGAFVVTTNASWGVDFGQPADAPLWCDFYDTMGQEGIMSCGATINGEENIDVVGDLPTACPSDWLISVTNMNHFDEKVNGAGYGLNTIDLGAFGQGTWTAAAPNGYGGFGGTSGATPHVAGTVALLYSTDCPSFAILAKSNPAQAALNVKEYILNGVDPNPSLQGITVTEGRLNVHNALNNLLDDCEYNTCVSPYGLAVENVLDVSADLLYSISTVTDTVNIRYKAISDNTWVVLNDVTDNPAQLTGLMACTDYEVQSQAICEDTVTVWSSSYIFTSEGCCVPPENISIENITENSVSLFWDEVFAAVSYQVEFTIAGENNWLDITAVNNNISLFSLETCTSYEVRVKTLCPDGSFSELGDIITFYTMGCGACVDLPYCTNSADASEEWISNVTIDAWSNSSGSDGGYGNYTLSLTDVLLLQEGTTYSLSLSPGFAGQVYNEHFRIWVDFNMDGDFEDTDELVFDAPNTTQNTISSSFTVPISTNFLEGSTRMRVAMRWDNPAELCQNFDYGEVEDYCVQLKKMNNSNSNIFNNVNINIAPNPVVNKLELNIQNNISNYEFYMNIYDETGKLLFNKNIQNNNTKINLKNWTQGIYFLEVIQGENKKIFKFIKI